LPLKGSGLYPVLVGRRRKRRKRRKKGATLPRVSRGLKVEFWALLSEYFLL